MMNKFFMVLLFMMVGAYSFAQDSYLNIDADLFETKEKQNKLYFEGNVKLTKNEDFLTSQRLVINTKASEENPEKKVPKDYVATGDVKFTIHTKDKNILKGSGDKVYYYPSEQRYMIVGNGYLENTNEGKKINANKIYIDEKTGYTKIDGKKNEPAKFTIKLENNSEKEDKE